MKKILAAFGVAFTVFLSLSQAQAREVPMPYFPKEVILTSPAPDGTAGKIVHDAIIKGALERTWQVVSDTPNKLRLKILVRNKHEITVDVTIDGDSVTVDYVGSVNMNYAKKEDGSEVIHPNYASWVNNMLNSARAAALLR